MLSKRYGDGGLWVRPPEMLPEPVDQVKSPDCPQAFRFELFGAACAAHK